jgi:hypothetical protein
MSGGYGCAPVRGGHRHEGLVRRGGCDGSCCKLLWWPVRQRLCCFDGDGGLIEAGIESRRVVAMLRTRGAGVHGCGRLSGRGCWHSDRMTRLLHGS